MKGLTKIALGVLTSVGGFLEAGSLGTSLEAGASYRYQLLWALALGLVCVAILTEMTGRLAAVSRHTVVDAMRKRFGVPLQTLPFVAQLLVNLFVLACEIGGAAYAVHLATGRPMPVFVLPLTALLWIVLWRAKFGQIEHSMAALGLVTLAFAVAAWKLVPNWSVVAGGLLPRMTSVKPAHYAYLAVAIVGASVSPYLLTFYSSGAVEEKWTSADLRANRTVAAVGMCFGGFVAGAVIIVSAIVLAPAGVQLESFDQASQVLTPVFGAAGFWLFCAALFIGCIGAAFEIALDLGYVVAQTFGWEWSENRKVWTEARFSVVYSIGLALAAVPALAGVDPFGLTMITMALTALALPLVVGPLLVIMNDEHYLKQHTNGPIANGAVIAIVALAFVLAIVSVPLQLLGSS